MGNKEFTNWHKFGIIMTALIPLVIAVVGIWHSQSQEKINRIIIQEQNNRDEANRMADRLTALIKHLASDNPKERTIAINVAGALLSQQKLPVEITSTIIALSKSADKDEAKAAQSFAQALKRDGKADVVPVIIKGQGTKNNDQGILIWPAKDGEDVIVPHLLINAIPGFDEKKPVYAANDINGWLVLGKNKANTEALRLTTMKRERGAWRAYGMVGKRFHPAQLIDTDLADPFTSNNIAWAKIENIYRLSEPFVDMTGSGPSLLVR